MNKPSTLILSGLSTALISTLAAAPIGAAQRAADPVTITAPFNPQERAIERVSFADLNLAAARDQKLLYRRISHASFRVCTPQALGVAMSDEQFAGCSRTALEGAKPQVAQAIERARQIASNGWSNLPAVSVAVTAQL